MFSAAAHSHVLVQPRSLVPRALPVDPVPLILVVFTYFLDILLNFYFTIFSFQFPSYLFNFYVCKAFVCPDLPSLICPLLSYRKDSYFIPYFLHSLSIFSFFWAYSLSNTQLQSCLLPFPTSFFLLFDPLLDDDLLRPDQVPHACWMPHLHN